MAFTDKLRPTLQKKLLALDGGGIRGVLTLEILATLEGIVRVKLGREDAVLADYFDFVAGTSTGAIIAVCIALGMSVTDIMQFYLASGREMFSRAALLRRMYTKYEDDRLALQLQRILGVDTTLGSDRLRTLLMMVMRNATTDSPWPLCNNPRGKYNERGRDGCNLDLPLWQLVRASTAAPTFFPPELISVGTKDFLFVDGGVTMYNNPAFHLFLMATSEPYNLCWSTGKDRMLLVSVGTGTSPKANANLQADDMNLFYNAGTIPSALMYAALTEQDFLCRVFGDTRAGCALDREVGDMIGMAGPAMPKLFTYMRYNAELSDEGFRQLGITAFRPEAVQALDSVEHIDELRQVGQAVAKVEINAAKFDDF